MEVRGIKADIVDMLEHIDEWSKGEQPDAGFILGTLGGAWLRKEPLGVSFIIAAWNFPLYTLLSPAVAAIAAGKSRAISSRVLYIAEDSVHTIRTVSKRSLLTI